MVQLPRIRSTQQINKKMHVCVYPVFGAACKVLMDRISGACSLVRSGSLDYVGGSVLEVNQVFWR